MLAVFCIQPEINDAACIFINKVIIISEHEF